jgi:DNA-binding beta-propeller fold protein YncE
VKQKSLKTVTHILVALAILAVFSPFLLSGNSQAKQGKPKAPEFPASLTWLNSEEKLSFEKLNGHVVLLYFWNYGSIYCLHTLPDMEYLQQKYEDKPFYVIGIHSGMFYNEQDPENVRSALARLKIDFPVVVDTKHVLRKGYGIRAWPTYVLIGSDRTGLAAIAGERRREVLERLVSGALKTEKKSNTLAQKKYTIKRPALKETQLSFPTNLALDLEKRILYISDSSHHQLVEAALQSPLTAKVLNRIGSGKQDLKNGSYSSASFSYPQGIAFHKGILYVADMGNHAIRTVDLAKQSVKTRIGNGEYGEFGKPNSPRDLVVYDKTLYITMAGSHQIWTMDVNGKEIELYVGNGYENFIDGSALGSSLAQPSGITVDSKGKRLYFTDTQSSALRYSSLEDGSVKTLIGKGLYKYGFADGTYAEAALQLPLGICYINKKIYMADTYNHALREIDIEKGEILTLLRPRSSRDKTSCIIDGKDSGILSLNEPGGLLVFDNRVYIADTNNHLIRVYDLTAKKMETLKLEE